MKIRDLLERFEAENPLALNDLDSLQRRTYRRVLNGDVNIDTAEGRELDTILDLIDLGILNQDGEVTSELDSEFESTDGYRTSADDDLELDGIEFDDFATTDDRDDYSGVSGNRLREPDSDDIDFMNLR